MAEAAILREGKAKKSFLDELREMVPAGNLSLCLTCGLCSSGCPATGLEDMDPRKFLRMLVLGMDEEVLKSDWPWMCTMCQRCVYVCPMKIDIPSMIFNIRASRPRDQRPKGIRNSCDVAVASDTCSAMGTPVEDFKFVVNDVLEEYRAAQPEFADMEAPIDKAGAEFFINQNSREPMTEPDEMVPCGRSSTSPRLIGPTAARPGRPRITVCFWPTTKAGKRWYARRRPWPMNLTVRRISTRSEVT